MSSEAREDGGLSQPSAPAPCWNLVAVGLPALALVVGILALVANPSGRGDYAGAIGGAVLLVFGVGAACALGAIAALIALCRGERLLWLTLLGIAGNSIVLVPLLVLFLRD
jgi:hypothetical protein